MGKEIMTVGEFVVVLGIVMSFFVIWGVWALWFIGV